MPGTIGSFLATLIILILPISSLLLFFISGILFIIGVVICDIYITKYRFDTDKDPSYVVIDEACGVFLGCSVIYYFGLNSIIAVFVNFLLFRFFDILKPFPIKNIEKFLKNNDKTVGIGIMIDDVLAAVFAATFQVIGGILWGK
jgi:phosphatidylglycerophosphatase A